MSFPSTAPAPRRRSRNLPKVAATAVVALALLAALSYALDARMAVYAEGLKPESRAWGWLLSDLGLSGYMFAVSGLLVVGALLARLLSPARRHSTPLKLLAERAGYIFAVLAVSGVAAQVMKHLIGRARPSSFNSFGPYHFALLSMKNSLASFPSGHSATAFGMAVALSLLMPSLRVALFALALGIASSRIVVQAHYVSDILAGASLGAASALVTAKMFAARGVAFANQDGRLMLKGAGTIAAALARRGENRS